MLNTRAFWNLFKPASAKFTLEELRDLYGVLARNPVVSEANRALVVETIRRVAEYMIWGDQNEPRIFDFFLENNIMTYLHKVLLQPANRTGEVAKQVLQTLSIIIQNVRSETAIFFLFSNNHLNNIVDLDFDFEDEEVLGYYISFLKTISLKLNRGTVQFFLNTHREQKGEFPLYTRAIKLAHNREGMVRAAVRTLTLHVYSVVDPDIIDFVTSAPASKYFTEVALYLAEQIQLLDRRMLAAEVGGSQALASLDSQLAEVEDVVSYVSDLLSLGVPGIAQLLASNLWQNVTQPLLLRPLMQPGAAAAAAAPIQQQVQARAGMLGSGSKSGGLVGSPSGLKAGSPSLKGSNWSSSSSVLQQLDSGKQGTRVRPVCAVFVLERLFQLVMYPPLLQQLLLALTCGGSSNTYSSNSAGSDSCARSGDNSSSVSCRSILLGILTSSDAYSAVMVLRLLVAVLHNRHISPELLAALSILPRRVQQQQGSLGFSSSSASKDSGQLAYMVQAVLKQLQELTATEQQQHQKLQQPGSSNVSGATMHRRSSSMNLLNLLTQQYLPNQLQALVQGQEGGAAAGAELAAAASGNCHNASFGVIQGLEAWLAAAEESVTETAAGDAAAAAGSSAFSALGPQLLSALLQLLQHAGLPSQGIRLLGWLLHQLLPVAPMPDSPPAAMQQQHHHHHGASTPSPLPTTAEGSESQAAVDAPATDEDLIGRTASSSSSSDTSSVGGGSVIEHSESIDIEGSISRTSSLVSGAGASTDVESQADLHVTPPPVSLAHSSSFRSVTSTCEQRGSVLSLQQQQLLQLAVDSAVEQFQQQLQGMWCEAVFPMLAQEWPVSREMLQRPVLRAASDALLSGTAVWPLLQGLQAAAAAASGVGGGGAAYDALSVSGKAALACYIAVQRVVAVKQLQELLVHGGIPRQPPVPIVTEADLKQVDIQEGYQVDLAPGSALPCVVSFAPGQERRVYFAVAGLSRKQLAAIQSGSSHATNIHDPSSAQASLVRSLPLAVLADPSPSRPQAGIVLSVAPLLGAHPYTDQNVPKWLHVHVRPSVRGLLRVVKTATAKKGGLLSAMRQLADGHWVLAFSAADKAAAAVRLVEMHVDHLQCLYGDALAPLCGQQQQEEEQEAKQQQELDLQEQPARQLLPQQQQHHHHQPSEQQQQQWGAGADGQLPLQQQKQHMQPWQAEAEDLQQTTAEQLQQHEEQHQQFAGEAQQQQATAGQLQQTTAEQLQQHEEQHQQLAGEAKQQQQATAGEQQQPAAEQQQEHEEQQQQQFAAEAQQQHQATAGEQQQPAAEQQQEQQQQQDITGEEQLRQQQADAIMQPPAIAEEVQQAAAEQQQHEEQHQELAGEAQQQPPGVETQLGRQQVQQMQQPDLVHVEQPHFAEEPPQQQEELRHGEQEDTNNAKESGATGVRTVEQPLQQGH